jgi:ATP-binding cassette subfamily B protein
MASLERIFEIMDYPVLIKNSKDAKPMKKIEGNIEFSNVTFGYTPEQTVLKDISFKVKPGQSIAFVGPTGAGKSTVINLLSRFYDIRSGSIKIDGMDIRDIDLDDLRTNIGIMLQETFMFAGTITDNIRYGKLDATDEEIIKACKAVNAHDFIMQMEKGYDTQVGERGSRLSMGQRQLISFARTLLSDPHVLILDEATASIDTNTEMLIQKAIEVVLKGRTSFVIAHRLSTIRKSDCIMVINNQNIAERGTHDELMKQKGHYYDLCKAQYDYLKAV